MIEIALKVPDPVQSGSVPEIIERVCAAESLTITLRSTLAQYPNSLHWHLKLGNERGILEVTWWAQQNKLWFKVAAGRTGSWIDATAARLKQEIEAALLTSAN